MSREFVHPLIGEAQEAISGHYKLIKEDRLPFAGGEVLYLLGYGVLDTSCCGEGGISYALVPGLIVRWKHRVQEDGLAVSEIEPITDPKQRQEIEATIKKTTGVIQVQFAE